MFKTIMSWFTSPPLTSFDQTLTREALIQSGRIVIIDDDTPLLIEELRSEGFGVDHDLDGSDLRNIENQIYDLAIVDYQGVGQRLGSAQGLDLVKHIRRVSPRTRIVAYTSRSLDASESDFFRLSHAVLPKDMGLGDSLVLVEAELKKAFSKEHLFDALLAKLSISNDGEKKRIRAALVKSLATGNGNQFQEKLTKIAGSAAEKAVQMILAKLFIVK